MAAGKSTVLSVPEDRAGRRPLTVKTQMISEYLEGFLWQKRKERRN